MGLADRKRTSGVATFRFYHFPPTRIRVNPPFLFFLLSFTWDARHRIEVQGHGPTWVTILQR